jgi:hypothetical protein
MAAALRELHDALASGPAARETRSAWKASASVSARTQSSRTAATTIATQRVYRSAARPSSITINVER